MTKDAVQQTIAERGVVYGDPILSHENIGLSWAGLIQQHYGIRLDHPLPASLVCQMMVALKIHRAARVYKGDNYIDGHAYLQFAEGCQIDDMAKGEGQGAKGETSAEAGAGCSRHAV